MKEEDLSIIQKCWSNFWYCKELYFITNFKENLSFNHAYWPYVQLSVSLNQENKKSYLYFTYGKNKKKERIKKESVKNRKGEKKREISSCKQIVLFLIHKYSTSTLVLGKKNQIIFSGEKLWAEILKSKIAH